MARRGEKEPLKVSTDGTGGPYIIVTDAELETVKNLLDANKWGYQVDLGAIRSSDAGDQHVINLGNGADVQAIQSALNSLH